MAHNRRAEGSIVNDIVIALVRVASASNMAQRIGIISVNKRQNVANKQAMSASAEKKKKGNDLLY